MRPAQPLVSVNMVTYNHEKYLAASIRSVLDQPLSDLELVIVDDGSTDGTPEVIASFKDPRIVALRQSNQGPNAATNNGLRTCQGRYVALMSGDDLCHPDRLRVQLEAYREGPSRLLFSSVNFIDEHGAPMRQQHFAEQLFDTSPLTRAQIFRRFFDHGNFVNSITCFTEAAVLKGAGPFDPTLFQLADFDMWVRLVKHYGFQFLPVATVLYRIRQDGMNLSAPTAENVRRHVNEYYLIKRRFFDDVPADLFREAFHDRLRRPECKSTLELACEQTFLYLDSNDPLNRLIAVEHLHGLLSNPEAVEILRNHHHFTVHSFGALLRQVDVFGHLTGHITALSARLQDCEHQLRACHEERQAGHQQLQSILTSRSWRIASRLSAAWKRMRQVTVAAKS